MQLRVRDRIQRRDSIIRLDSRSIFTEFREITWRLLRSYRRTNALLAKGTAETQKGEEVI